MSKDGQRLEDYLAHMLQAIERITGIPNYLMR
jgi:hypothetical protein